MKFIEENILLIVVAFLSGAMLIWPSIARRSGNLMSANAVVALMNHDDAQLIDIRAAEDFAKSHVAQAKNYPLTELENSLPNLNKNKPVVIMDQMGKNTAKAAKILRTAGFEKVIELEGGLASWVTANMPTVKG